MKKENARLYVKEFDDIDTEFGGDIGEWLNNRFLDIRYTIDSRGDLVEVCLLASYGGPSVWVCLDGTDRVRVEVYEAFKEPQKFYFTHPKAKEVFVYLDDLLHETLITT